MPRLFLAVPVRLYNYETIRNEIHPYVQGRWVADHQLHLTVAFFGKRFTLQELLKRLEGIEFTFIPSELQRLEYLSGSGILAAMTDNPTLQNLYEHIAAVTELPITPMQWHVTLIRIKRIVDPENFSARLAALRITPIGKLESKIVLYHSELSPEGAKYTPLKEWETAP
ncbi:MAG TPA: 2'-5' RNA ligase family protein [Sulfuricurvum sp.]|nr:2'-5' RNA ligase family protein [Sulfuricurvum sp.]